MEFERVPSSFRDPAGYVVSHGGVFKRVVTRDGRADYDSLVESGLYRELADGQLLLSHSEEHVIPDEHPEIHKIISPEQLDFVSYPYEWCFSQLRDAALLTLDVQERALRRGMSLKDASAFNIQFRNTKPVFIDTLSFEEDHGGPWIAYEQFCRHFLAPLCLMATRSPRFAQYLRVDIDGFPLEFASRLLGWRSYFRVGPLLHIHMHSRSHRRAVRASRPGGGPGGRLKRNLVESLRHAVESLGCRREKSEWSDYEHRADHYPAEAVYFKKTFVEAAVEHAKPDLVYDCGGNTGAYSRVAAASGARCVLFDSDPLCVELAYRSEKASGNGRVLPLLMDLGNPTPALGFGLTERLGLLDRPRAGLVMALALVHHLRIRENIPFENLAKFFSRLGRTLVVEFVTPQDPILKAMLHPGRPAPDDYTVDGFVRAFSREFTLRETAWIPGVPRCLLRFDSRS